MKKTLVIGASENAERYSHKAIHMLRKYKHEVEAIGNKAGKVLDVEIKTGKLNVSDIDTVTMYIGEARQDDYVDYIIDLKPKRIIFNPGAENHFFKKKAEGAGIYCIEACTLVLLSTGQY